MELHEMLAVGYSGILRTLDYTLKGLTKEDINWQPKPDCNSIGWMVWHPIRFQDMQISEFMGEEQLWIKDGWYKKWGRKADPKESGGGMTPEDLTKFKSPGAATVLAYAKAVVERSQKYFPTLKKADLDKILKGGPHKPYPTVGMMLMIILSDSLQHAGQAGYVRGLRQGIGWH
jgi:hypothetical protein